MDIIRIKEELKSILKPSRYQHSLGVENVATDLAAIYAYDMDKAGLAGILHDCARNLSDNELLCECAKYGLPVTDAEGKCPYLLHAKLGALYARIRYGVGDEDILNAIYFHTTGRPAMTLPEKIIFTADYIEPNRKPLPRIRIIRELAYDNLDLAVCMILENMLGYLESSAEVIDSITTDSYKYYRKLLQD